MSEEFKKEEINGEAAEKTKAAEHTEEVKAETTAEQSAAETEKPQETAEAPKAEEKKTTTYSWVNPKISGKTGRSFINVSFIVYLPDTAKSHTMGRPSSQPIVWRKIV